MQRGEIRRKLNLFSRHGVVPKRLVLFFVRIILRVIPTIGPVRYGVDR